MVKRQEPDEFVVGERSTIAPDAIIRASKVVIGRDCTIDPGVSVFCPGGFTLGDCSHLGPRTNIKCWRFSAGAYLYCEKDVEVGRGGCLSSQDSVVEIGDDVMLNAGVVLNPNCRIKIGSHVGIGAEAAVWTHGAWLAEFGSRFAPVTIGDRVWLTGRSQVLPGVTIGDDVVVGMLSLVNRDLPPGCLAGGVPVGVLREHRYPLPFSYARVQGMLAEYAQSLAWRGIAGDATDCGDGLVMAGGAAFDLEQCTASNVDTPLAEDFRDFVRRRGYRILTGKPFRSLPHVDIARWEAC